MGIFASCAYFTYIGYFPRLSDIDNVLYYLFVITIVAVSIPFILSTLFISPIFVIDEIFKKIERVKGKELWCFMIILFIQPLLLSILPFVLISFPKILTSLYILSMFISPALFLIFHRYFGMFCFKNNGSYGEKFYICMSLSLLGLCIFIPFLFAIFMPVHTGIIIDICSILQLSIGLMFLFICAIVFLV